ncbi:MAG: RNA-binding protein [Francisellaceae bacterium]|nr:RNA-binding protein [Francisellaceae bacterium]
MDTIKISNVAPWVTELNLKDFFYRCGKIKKIQLFTSEASGRSQCKGAIIFEEQSAMIKALSLDGKMLDGFKIQIQEITSKIKMDGKS